jgi:cell shape-determining protein MreC
MDATAQQQPTDEAMAAATDIWRQFSCALKQGMNVQNAADPPPPENLAQFIDEHTRLPQLKRENERLRRACKAAIAELEEYDPVAAKQLHESIGFVIDLLRAAIAKATPQ